MIFALVYNENTRQSNWLITYVNTYMSAKAGFIVYFVAEETVCSAV